MIAIGEYTISIVNDGATGPQGPQGTSVTKVVREYTKSSSSSTLPSNPSWSETEPTIGTNEYLWARDRTDLSDGTSTYGPAICSTNISGIKHDVDKANKSITDKVWESDITTKINQYDGSTVSTIRDRVSTTETDISGIKTRVSDVESETDDLGTRMTTAETAIDQTANNVVIKATQSDTTAAQGGQHLIQSLINVAPSGVTISADKVNIEGATIFSSGRLSQTSLNNAYDAKGAAATVQSNLDNLQIGGRNLVKHTASPKANNSSFPTANLDTTDGWYRFGGNGSIARTTEGIKLTSATSSQSPTGFQIPLAQYDIISGIETLTLSFKYRTNTASWSQIYLLCMTSPNVVITFPSLTVSESSWMDFKHTFNFPSHGDRIAFALLLGYKRDDGTSWLEIKDSTLKLEFGNKPTSWTPAPEDISSTSIKETVPVYYRSTTSSAPTISSSTSIGTSNNSDNAWSYVMPLPKRDRYFFISEKYVYADSSIAFSTVRPLDSQTYASKWVSSADNTYIDGGRLYAHSVTTSQLATDAIKSNNYQASQNANSPYSATGSFLDLSNGNFYTPNFGIDNTNGKAYLNGEIIADSGQIGSDATNYWEIGTKTDYNATDSAAIIGHGSSYIQSGGWMISADRIDTRSYDNNDKYTYPLNNNTYWDFGLHVPNLTSNNVYENNFIYIRKHESTIPTLEGQWDYVFRVDRDGAIEATGLKINGTTIQDMITAGVDGGAYLPISGGTITGNLTVNGTITGLKSLSINGKTYNGTTAVTVGTLGIAYGGTGKTTAKDAANVFIDALDTGSSDPVDGDTYIASYADGKNYGHTGTNTYHRRNVLSLYRYIKSKLLAEPTIFSDTYVLKSGDTITGSLTVENGIYSDSAQLGDLIVTGAGRFANGLYGDLIGNADTATKAAKVADSGNGTETTFAYSKSGLTTASWIAAWSGYELRAISPANLLTTIGAQPAGSYVSKTGDTMTGNLTVPTIKVDSIVNEGTNEYTHRIDLGRPSFNHMDFYEYGGIYNFYKNTVAANTDSATLLGKITSNGWEGNVVGNATTATKFSSSRTIQLTGDVTGSASGDGSSGWSIATTIKDYSHYHTPNNIIFNNMGLANNIDPITRAYIGSAMSNKTFGLPANCITIEYSTNGGSTWLDYEATDMHKKNLFTETRTGCNTYLGKASTKEANTVNNQLRITIEPIDRYVGLDGLYIWMSNNGNTVTVDLERSTIGAKDTFTTVFTGQPIAGWSGNNIRYFPYAAFGGGSTQTSNCYKYRLIFKQTAINSNYPSANIYDIRFLGSAVHSSSNNMVLRNHLYSWDADQNATFPAQLTATQFNGNATSASKLNSTRSFTIGKTAKNVDWSGAVSFSQAEISDNASTTAAGWMSKDDKLKLNGIETGAQVNTITGVKGNSESSYRTGNVNITAANIGLGNLTNDKQVKGLSSGTTSGHFVTWGSDGYTVADSGIAKGNVATKITLSGTDYSASSNTITITKANLQSAVQDTSLVLMTAAERSKLSSIQVSEGGTIDFSGVTATAPLTATVNQTTKAVNITHNTSGVSAGTYRSVTVNTYGHVTAGTNPTTLSGYGITDAKIASGIITLGSNTITPLTASSTLDATKLSGTASISTTGNASTATAFSSNASVTLTGDTTGTVSSKKGWSIATTTKKLTTLGRMSSADLSMGDVAYRGKLTTMLASYAMETNKPGDDGYILNFGWDTDVGWGSQLYLSHTTNPHIKIRAGAGSNGTTNWGTWRTVLDENNYNSYSPTLTGTGASGTWGIGISGNATTATKFSSNRSIALSGDVTGSASSNGENGWNISTTVGDDSHNHTVDTIVPKLSKSYTGVIASANDDANCYLYCIKIVPETYNGQWEIKYRVYADMDGIADSNGNGREESIVYVSGMRSTYAAYRTWNNITNTSYRPYYYHNFRFVNEANISYGHICGISLRYAYNPNNATYKRNVTFEILESKNCTVSFFDSPLIYDNVPSTGNYSGITNFDATTQGNTMTGDRNDVNYEQREYWASRTAYKFCGRYQLLVTRPDGQVFPVNTTDNNITTTKTYDTSAEFDPFGQIFYHYTSGTTAANGNIGDNRLFNKFRMDLRYAFNVGGNNADSLITARKPFYLVATPQANGLAKIHSSGFSQDLPTSDDGLIYIYLGTVYEDAKPWRLNLTINHPVYWYKDGAVRQYVQRAETANTATKLSHTPNNTTTFLRGDNTWSSLLTNSISIAKAGECGVEVTNSQATNPNQVAFIVGNSGNGGIFSRKHSKWIVYSDTNGNIVLNGNANTATKATSDGDGNTISSTYLKLSGGTMTGTEKFNSNMLSIDFRDNTSYRTGFYYGTSGNEALALAMQNAVTSFMVVHGSTPSAWSGGTWNTVTPTLQTKNNSLYVHELIPNAITPSYNFKVNGTSYLGGEVKISDTNADTASVSMVYDRDMQCLNFIFN